MKKTLHAKVLVEIKVLWKMKIPPFGGATNGFFLPASKAGLRRRHVTHESCCEDYCGSSPDDLNACSALLMNAPLQEGSGDAVKVLNVH